MTTRQAVAKVLSERKPIPATCGEFGGPGVIVADPAPRGAFLCFRRLAPGRCVA